MSACNAHRPARSSLGARLFCLEGVGYSVEFGGQDIRLKDGENFIQKPYSVDSLLEIVRRNLDGPPGRAGGR